MISCSGSATLVIGIDWPPPGTSRMPCGPVAMRAVGTEMAALAPAALRPVTATRSVLPASVAATTYVVAVAPGMAWQAPPLASHEYHCWANVTGSLPDQVPGA